MRPTRCPILFLVAALVAGAGSAGAQEDPTRETGWFDTAELSYVATGGNAEADTLALKNVLRRVWKRSAFELSAGGLRAETTTRTLSAVGTSAADATVRETETSRLTAENYHLKAAYDRRISERLFWFAGAGWERNRFAGIESRASIVAGVGNVWLQGEALKLRTEYGLTATREEEVGAPRRESFLGGRFSWRFWKRLTATSAYGNDLDVDLNLDETSDLRAVMAHSLSVSMSKRMALKVGLELLYDGRPARLAVPVVTPVGTDTGDVVMVELDELDTQFTAALVIDF